MVLRWIHKGWKTFWTIVLSLLLFVIVIGGGVLALLQLDATKDVIAEKIENDFQKNYNGRLTIGNLEGFLPFNAELQDVVLTSPGDTASADTLVSIKSAKVGIDIWGLIQKKLSIDAFQLNKPSVRLLANGHGAYTLKNALTKKNKPQPDSSSKSANSGSSWIKDVEITAPQVTVNDGSFYIERFYGTSKNVNLPTPLRVNEINAKMFVELTDARRYAEMEKFTAKIPALKAGDISLSGQIYNDDKALEFNAFQFAAGHSQIRLNGTINGVDLYNGNIHDQLLDADYDITVSSEQLQLNEFTDFLPKLPAIDEPLHFTVQTTGTMRALHLNTFTMGVGDSYFNINGEVQHLLQKSQLAYHFNIDTLAVHKKDVEDFTGPLNAKQYQALENFHVNGQAHGTADSLIVDVSGSTSLGSFQLNGKSQLVKPFGYEGSLSGQHVDIGPLAGAGIDTTSLNFKATVSGQNTSLKTGRLKFVGRAKNSFINRIAVDSLRLTTSLQRGHLNTKYYYSNKNQSIQGEATADFNKKDPPITLKGNTKHLNLPALFANIPLDSTSLNTNYEVDMQGTKPDRMQGMAKFEVDKSVVNGDSVEAHQIEVQLDSPDQPSRTLQITSSLFNLRITGNLQPTNISNEATYWSNYFKKHIAQEIRFDSTAFVPKKEAPFVHPLQVNGHLEAKNLTLLKKYWPTFPSLITNSTADFKINADSSDLQFSSQIQSDTLRINTVQVKGAGSQLNGHFNYDQTLKESGKLRFETSARRIESNLIKMDSVDVNLDYQQDSLYYSQQVKRFSKNARFNLKMRSKLTKADINVYVDNFFLGNNTYAWKNEGTPQLTYNRAKKFIFDSFRFKNENEFFALKGTFSPDRSDSLQYLIHDVDLARISGLLKGNINFAGRLNGSLQTRSLTRTPSVQGNLKIDGLKLQNRLVGDLTFSSTFNEKKDRFDTRLKVLTDSTKYQKYLSANNGIGQNILFSGYFKPANLKAKNDSVFYFDANFKEIDMWVVQLITPNIFNKLQGRATGHGYISGNLNDINFNTDFQVHNVYAHPNFLQTDYYLDGHVKFDRKQGLLLDKINIKDKHGGTGSLSGTVDLNDFKPISYIDLRMTLNNLQFLNSGYSLDTPFYGDMAGTGRVRLSGPNTDLKLQSLTDIKVSQNSTFAIPLITQTELNTTNNFIRFVDSFENPAKTQVDLSEHQFKNAGLSENALQQAISNLSFNERFNIDLQFDAPDPISVRLIFDPVTGEELHAEGTGRLRVSMNEGQLQMFGNFNVTGGNYQFVSGEIFSRKLDIRPGGSITWEGPPNDARLNVDAVYHARPDLSSLNNTSLTDNTGGGAPQRVSVDLIVQITGTISNVQNNYYFEVPNNFEITTNSTLQYRLNQINNDQQQKLLQATSILLAGNFLNTGSSQTSQLSQTLTRSSTFINPVLSNQVISPLLSNQINSLLNSDVTQFDVNFELNQYNQIDLGIALRLYNDKLIFRREGYLTGGSPGGKFSERIGDLKATYRINRNLSLTAFHRQDQPFGTVASNQNAGITQTIDGAGIQAQVQFNTWQQLSHKVRNFLRRLMGKPEINYDDTANDAKATASMPTTQDSTITAKQ